jgi:hypothetical protein
VLGEKARRQKVTEIPCPEQLILGATCIAPSCKKYRSEKIKQTKNPEIDLQSRIEQ